MFGCRAYRTTHARISAASLVCFLAQVREPRVVGLGGVGLAEIELGAVWCELMTPSVSTASFSFRSSAGGAGKPARFHSGYPHRSTKSPRTSGYPFEFINPCEK